MNSEAVLGSFYLHNKEIDWQGASKENGGERTKEKNGMKELEKSPNSNSYKVN